MATFEDILPAVGDHLGSYELEEELGRGGFGIVFRAKQKSLAMDVAIKVMIPQFGSMGDPKQWLARFEQEALILKKLRHSSTIRILDYGHTDSNLPFFVLEFVRGQELSHLIREGMSLVTACNE